MDEKNECLDNEVEINVLFTFTFLGGWTNPIEQYVCQIGSFLQGSGWT